MKKAIFIIILLSQLMFSSVVFSSPWSCFNQWINNEQSLLQTNQISFWHSNNGLIEDYALNAKEPIIFLGYGIGLIISQHVKLCGCTVTDGFYLTFKHLEGLCGHY